MHILRNRKVTPHTFRRLVYTRLIVLMPDAHIDVDVYVRPPR